MGAPGLLRRAGPSNNRTANLLIGGGAGLIGVAGLMYWQDTNERKFRESIFTDASHADRIASKAIRVSADPEIFKARVKAVSDMFDGPIALTGVKVGDIVSVVEAKTGP